MKGVILSTSTCDAVKFTDKQGTVTFSISTDYTASDTQDACLNVVTSHNPDVICEAF